MHPTKRPRADRAPLVPTTTPQSASSDPNGPEVTGAPTVSRPMKLMLLLLTIAFGAAHWLAYRDLATELGPQCAALLMTRNLGSPY